MTNKEKFRENLFITTYDSDGNTDIIYPDSMDDGIKSFKESIYNGDIVKFDIEYNTKDKQDKVRIRHKLTFTSYDGEPEYSERMLDYGKNI